MIERKPRVRFHYADAQSMALDLDVLGHWRFVSSEDWIAFETANGPRDKPSCRALGCWAQPFNPKLYALERGEDLEDLERRASRCDYARNNRVPQQEIVQ